MSSITMKLSAMCDDCRLQVAKTTFRHHKVILILREVGRSFCSYLSGHIIDASMRLRINKSVTDAEALSHIRDALDCCEDPDMIAHVLEVLRLDDIGKATHADMIQQFYYEEIDRHKLCEKCDTGMVQEILPVDMHEYYTEQEREALVGYKIFVVVPLGESMAGKTTLLSKIKNMAFKFPDKPEHTIVAEVSSWSPPERNDVLFMLYDVGGQESYKNTAHVFQVDSSQMINLVCHDLSSSEEKDFQNTMAWIKICQRNAPNSEIRILLTRIDKVDEGQREHSRKTFIERFSRLIEQEITLTENYKAKGTDNKRYTKQLENYINLKTQVKSKLLEISCKSGHEDSVKLVTDYLMKFADDSDNQEVMLRPMDKELFVKIGKMGIRQHMIDKSQVNEITEDLQNESNEGPAVNREIRNDGKAGTSSIERDKVQPQIPVKLPEQPVMKQQFVEFSKVKTEFKQVYMKHHKEEIAEETLWKEARKSLENLKKKGLLRYFIEKREFEDGDIIFNDLSTLVSILRCVFHHDLHTTLEYNPTDKLCLYHYTDPLILKEDKDSLKNCGILSMTLLKFLLERNNCEVEASKVADMFVSVNVGVRFETNGDEKMFIPFFLEHKQSPLDLEDQKEKMYRCKEDVLSLETTLIHDIPLSFFNELRVKIYKRVERLLRYDDFLKAWGKGMSLDLDEKEGKMLMYYNQDNSVKILLQAEITEAEGHKFLFENLAYINQDTEDIRKAEYPGLPLGYALTCTHCIIEPEDGREKTKHKVEKLFSPDQPKETICCGKQSKFPRGLIMPLPEEPEKSKKCHTKLLEYLENHCEITVQQDLHKLCDDCLLVVSRATIKDERFIDVLSVLGKGFCNLLTDNVIASPMRQTIERAINDVVALGSIRDAFDDSLDPHMIDQLLKVLNSKLIGRKIHAQKIKDVYQEKIAKQTPCEKCCKDLQSTTSHDTVKKHYQHPKAMSQREEGETSQMSQERTGQFDQFSQSLAQTSVKTEGRTQIIDEAKRMKMSSITMENLASDTEEHKSRITWDQVRGYEEITEAFRQHTSKDDMDKVKGTLERQMYSLCKEIEMSDFITYVQQMIPQHEDCCNIEQYPDDFSKLMHLMDLVMHKPVYHSAFKKYCENKPALHKYIREDVSCADEMMGYNRYQYYWPNLCPDCLLQVAKRTLQSQDVILVLAKLGRSFCSHLSYTIITEDMWQKINRADNDAEAFFYIRQAFQDSLDPYMVDKLLQVLNIEQMGTTQHADRIKEIYHREIVNHKPCGNCTEASVKFKKTATSQDTLLEGLALHDGQQHQHLMSERVESKQIYRPEKETGQSDQSIYSLAKTSALQTDDIKQSPGESEIHPGMGDDSFSIVSNQQHQLITESKDSAMTGVLERSSSSREQLSIECDQHTSSPQTVDIQMKDRNTMSLTEHMNEMDMSFEISPWANSYYFHKENVTVVIPPNTLNWMQKPCTASITAKCHNTATTDAKSKIYEFSPSGLETQNRIMVVFPLFDSHYYDYRNMTLMYRENIKSDFICAKSMIDHKPTWLFHRNTCYLFLNHFCEAYIKQVGSGEDSCQITLDALLFYKQSEKDLKLKFTFGCYDEKSACSCKCVIEHNREDEYKIVSQEQAIVTGKSVTVIPKYSDTEWKAAFFGSGEEKIPKQQLIDMCKFCAEEDRWPVDVTYRFWPLQKTHQPQGVAVCFSNEDQSRTLLFNKENETQQESNQLFTWDQVECNADIIKIFYLHALHNDHTSETNSEQTLREQVEHFLDTFIKGYHGSSDVVLILKSLITYTRHKPGFEDVTSKLEWLKCKKNLETKMYALCKEDEMLGFPQYICDTIPPTENCSHTEQYPENFSKLMHLMDLSLQISLYYNAFKSYCEGRPALKKYITEDVSFTNEMMGYNRLQYNLPTLCDDCLLKVCKATIGDPDVISVLSNLGTGFCAHLDYNIITYKNQQDIFSARSDNEALFHIRGAFWNSLAPYMIDQLLEVLHVEKLGKKLHADKIRKVYHNKIINHKPCRNCSQESAQSTASHSSEFNARRQRSQGLSERMDTNDNNIEQSSTGDIRLQQTTGMDRTWYYQCSAL